MKVKYLLYLTLLVSLLVACADDDTAGSLTDDVPVSFAVRSEWLDGRGGGAATRAFDPLSKFSPAWVYVEAKGTVQFVADPDHFLVKPNGEDHEDPEGYTYLHDFYIEKNDQWVKQQKVTYTRGDARRLKFTAYYKLKEGKPYTADRDMQFWRDTEVPAVGTTDFLSSDETTYPGWIGNKEYIDHILFTLKHRTALFRLFFKVSDDYLKIRDIVLRKVQINGEDLALSYDGDALLDGAEGIRLSDSNSDFSYGYIRVSGANPITVNTPLTFKCTYDIYDKDGISAGHCTRKSVTATNTCKLSALPAAAGLTMFTKIQAGYYYDLFLTIDPDYLYVLSEHDNKKHLTIN